MIDTQVSRSTKIGLRLSRGPQCRDATSMRSAANSSATACHAKLSHARQWWPASATTLTAPHECAQMVNQFVHMQSFTANSSASLLWTGRNPLRTTGRPYHPLRSFPGGPLDSILINLGFQVKHLPRPLCPTTF